MSFFDKVGEKASEIYNATADKTSKITQEMKLKSTINENNTKINKVFQDIGSKIYENYKSEKKADLKEELDEKCYQISILEKENKEAQLKILTLKDIKLCEYCSKEISINAKFCPGCGKPQKENDIKKEPTEKSEVAMVLENKENTLTGNNAPKDILNIKEPDLIVEEIGNTDSKEEN